MPAIINSDDGVVSGSAGLKTSGASDGITAFQQNGTESVRITAAGNLLVGTTTTGSTGISVPSTFNLGWVQSAGESVPNIFRQTSSAATVVANGYRHTNTANGFASSFSSSFAKSAIALNEGTIRFYTDTAVTTAAGTDVTPTERARITSGGNFQFNSGYGSVATAYGCRAWVNFNGTGTVAIRASGNVTSITDNGTGDYTVNFTTAMPDANYAATSIGPNIANGGGAYSIATNDAAAPTSSAYRLNVQTAGGSMADRAYLFVAFFR